MSPLLIFIAAFFTLGLIPVLNGIRYAPEGAQDEFGFHFTWRNNRPDIRDVSCVWLSLSDVPAVDLEEEGSSNFHAA